MELKYSFHALWTISRTDASFAALFFSLKFSSSRSFSSYVFISKDSLRFCRDFFDDTLFLSRRSRYLEESQTLDWSDSEFRRLLLEEERVLLRLLFMVWFEFSSSEEIELESSLEVKYPCSKRLLNLVALSRLGRPVEVSKEDGPGTVSNDRRSQTVSEVCVGGWSSSTTVSGKDLFLDVWLAFRSWSERRLLPRLCSWGLVVVPSFLEGLQGMLLLESFWTNKITMLVNTLNELFLCTRHVIVIYLLDATVYSSASLILRQLFKYDSNYVILPEREQKH